MDVTLHVAEALRDRPLAGARLAGEVFHTCDLAGADLRGARLAGAAFIDCAWDGVRLDDADLEDALVFPAWPGWTTLTRAAARGEAAIAAELADRRAVIVLARALTAAHRDDVATATTLADEAAAAAPRWGRPRRLLGDLALRRGAIATAVSAYRAAQWLEPDDVATARRLAAALAEQGAIDEAIEQLAAHADDAGARAALVALADTRARRDQVRRVVTGTTGDHAAAAIALVELDLADGRIGEAFAALRDALARTGDARLLRPLAGLCLGPLDDPALAAEILADYLAVVPGDASAWIDHAHAIGRAGDAEGGLGSLARARRLGTTATDAAAAERLEPWLLDAALRFDEVLARPVVDGDDARLRGRALAAVHGGSAAAELAALAARTDLDPEARAELSARCAPSAASPALPAPSSAVPVAPPEMVDEVQRVLIALEAALRGTGVLAAGDAIATSALATPFGGLVTGAAIAGAPALIEVCFGDRQRALVLDSAASAGWQPSPWIDLDLPAGRVWMRSSRPAVSPQAPLAPAPSWRSTAPLSFPQLAAAEQARLATAVNAAQARVAGGIGQARALIDAHPEAAVHALPPPPVPDPDGSLGPYLAGTAAGPRWLADLLAAFHAPEGPAHLAAWAMWPVEPRVHGAPDVLLAEAAVVAWLLGPAATATLAIADASPHLPRGSYHLQHRLVAELTARLEVVARGLVAAALTAPLSQELS